MPEPSTIKKSLADIIGGCKRGVPFWQEELYTRYYGFAYSITMRYAASNEEAMESMNDGFVRMFRGIPEFKIPDDPDVLEQVFMAWLKRIMINTAINDMKTRKRKLTTVQATPIMGEAMMAYKAESPVSHLAYTDLVKLVQQLSPAYRNTFSLYAIEGYTHEEIARTLGISIGTSKSNLLKARKNLKEMLDKTYG